LRDDTIDSEGATVLLELPTRGLIRKAFGLSGRRTGVFMIVYYSASA